MTCILQTQALYSELGLRRVHRSSLENGSREMEQIIDLITSASGMSSMRKTREILTFRVLYDRSYPNEQAKTPLHPAATSSPVPQQCDLSCMPPQLAA
jgi:hypothetical protein